MLQISENKQLNLPKDQINFIKSFYSFLFFFFDENKSISINVENLKIYNLQLVSYKSH